MGGLHPCGRGATLNATYSVNLKGTEAATAATVYVESTLNLNCPGNVLRMNDGGTQNWYIGQSGYSVTLNSGATATPATDVTPSALRLDGSASFVGSWYTTLATTANADGTYTYTMGEGSARLVYDTTSKVLLLTAPEPTTATLSLLALAGLCARRRRSRR